MYNSLNQNLRNGEKRNSFGFNKFNSITGVSLMAAFAMFAYSGCKQDKQAEPQAEDLAEKVQTLNLDENAVAIASATVYSTATGSTVIGSIDVNENLDAGTVSGSRTQVTYKTTGADKTGWVASSAVRLTSWMWPIQTVYYTQDFHNYSSTRGGYHLAIDMKSTIDNDDVFAPHVGTVVYKGYSSGNGNHIILSHANGANPTVYTLYSHLTSIAPQIVNGYQVPKGEKMGVMGCTGSCTGKHLHFAVYSRNYSSDPYGYTSSGGSTVSHSDSKIVMSYTSGNVTHYDPQYVIRNSGQLP